MEDVVCNSAAPPKKSSTTLSMDRAAFLLLRVKKAFKRKRQQRKDKQAQAIIAAAHTHQTRAARKVPPPLLRSRTLPAIIVPGLPVVSFHTNKTQLHFDENIAVTKSINRGEPRWALLARNTATAAICFSNNNNNNNTNYTNFNNNTLSVKSLNLPKDDVPLAYRRKSSGSTPHSVGITPTVNYYPDEGRTPDTAVAASSHTATTTTITLVHPPSTLDDLACYGADGSVLLRIPVPEVVAAHAYRMTTKSSRPRGSDSFSNNYIDSNVVSPTPTFEASHHLTTWSDFNTSKFDLLYENKINSSSTSASSSTATISNSNSSNLALTRRFAKLLHQSSGSMGIKSQQQQPTEHIQHPRTVKLDNTDNNFSTLLTASTCYNDEAPRRLSWERRKDSSALQRSASIDSFAEIVWSDSPQPALEIPKSLVVPFSKRPSASSLYSTCSLTAQSMQVNVNYISGAGLDLSGGNSGNSGNGTNIASSSGNNRRESLLSPSATRRNKLTRVVNADIKILE